MDKWEYLTVKLQAKTVQTGKLLQPTISLWDAAFFSEQLNPYGEQGWELTSCFCTEASTRGDSYLLTGGTNGVFATFKRKTIK